MNYYTKATSAAGSNGSLSIKKLNIEFETKENTNENLPNPAELFLGAFAACILKNVERFSGLLKFQYDKASIHVTAVRQEHPAKLDSIRYDLEIVSSDPKLNLNLLKKNIEKFSTIYNSVDKSCNISGKITSVESAFQKHN